MSGVWLVVVVMVVVVVVMVEARCKGGWVILMLASFCFVHVVRFCLIFDWFAVCLPFL